VYSTCEITSVGSPGQVDLRPETRYTAAASGRRRAETGRGHWGTCSDMQQLIAGVPKMVGAMSAGRGLPGTVRSRLEQIVERAGVVAHHVRVQVFLRLAVAVG
jgi:hypothetical protein